jgi:hypothetical protein
MPAKEGAAAEVPPTGPVRWLVPPSWCVVVTTVMYGITSSDAR